MRLLRRHAAIPRQPPGRQTQRWLVGCSLLVQGLHAFHLPTHLALAGPALTLTGLFFARRSVAIPRLLPILLALVVALLAREEHRHLLGRDPGVSFLVVAIGLKLMEVRSRRDVTVVFCLLAFLLPTVFFYSHAIMATMVVVVAAVALLAGFAASRDEAGPLALRPALQISGTMMLQGLPVALLLFALFPRLSGPLWTLGTERAGRTGLSERMYPGGVTKLSLSDDVAFRVDFEGPVPATRDLYWRGPVLTHFDGRGWSTTLVPGEGQPLVDGKGGTAYRVSLEPHDRFWLFALDLPATLPSRARLTREQQLLSLDPITQAMQYRQVSSLTDRFPAVHGDEIRHALPLPYSGNRRTREWADLLRAESADSWALIQRVLRSFREDPFHYTLEPPEYGADGIDAFLFAQRRGFCEHYASAFAFVMRAAGIPARVVTGYQGGEVSPVGGYLIVRQADAHAWVEVWVDNQWRRIDPTAAVAPERIERGLGAAVPAGERLPLLSRLEPSWAKSLRLHWDAVNYRWQRWVVEFNLERQQLLWENLGMPRPEPWQVALALLSAGGAWLAMLALLLLRRRQPDAAQRLWERFCQQLAQAGLPRAAHEPPLAYARRAGQHWPQAAAELWQVALAYCGARYGAPAAQNLLRLRSAQSGAARLNLPRKPSSVGASGVGHKSSPE